MRPYDGKRAAVTGIRRIQVVFDHEHAPACVGRGRAGRSCFWSRRGRAERDLDGGSGTPAHAGAFEPHRATMQLHEPFDHGEHVRVERDTSRIEAGAMIFQNALPELIQIDWLQLHLATSDARYVQPIDHA
jgi:hypothetical protein